MMFGATADQWPDEVLFYRTGIALKLYAKGVRV